MRIDSVRVCAEIEPIYFISLYFFICSTSLFPEWNETRANGALLNRKLLDFVESK